MRKLRQRKAKSIKVESHPSNLKLYSIVHSLSKENREPQYSLSFSFLGWPLRLCDVCMYACSFKLRRRPASNSLSASKPCSVCCRAVLGRARPEILLAPSLSSLTKLSILGGSPSQVPWIRYLFKKASFHEKNSFLLLIFHVSGWKETKFNIKSIKNWKNWTLWRP